MKIRLKNFDFKLIFYILLISIICITVCSRNSFLYCFNDWEDENTFMTVARGWINGMIPYKDLCEQKGPFLYLIFVFANLMDKTSFIGAYILEIIFMSFTLYLISKIIKLYLEEKSIYLILPLFCSIITSSTFFVQGGSAEEFCFPFLVYGLYTLLKYFKTMEISNKEMFISGLCAGIISMIKFNLLGFYIGFCLSIGISLVIKKDKKNLFYKALLFLGGMFIPIVIFGIYFMINNALNEFIDAYILYNIQNYSVKSPFLIKIGNSFLIFFYQLIRNKVVMILIAYGLVEFVLRNRLLNKKASKILFTITFILSFIGVYYGGLIYNYYFLIITPYIILGLITLFYESRKLNKKRYSIYLSISILFSVILLSLSNNLSFLNVKKEELVQYKFAKIMNEKKDATMLNYGFLDGGFYMTSNILPNTRYFMRQNGNMENYESELKKEIDTKKFDYIVIMNYNNDRSKFSYIEENYELISTERQEYEDYNYYYLLYMKK